LDSTWHRHCTNVVGILPFEEELCLYADSEVGSLWAP